MYLTVRSLEQFLPFALFTVLQQMILRTVTV